MLPGSLNPREYAFQTVYIRAQHSAIFAGLVVLSAGKIVKWIGTFVDDECRPAVSGDAGLQDSLGSLHVRLEDRQQARRNHVLQMLVTLQQVVQTIAHSSEVSMYASV